MITLQPAPSSRFIVFNWIGFFSPRANTDQAHVHEIEAMNDHKGRASPFRFTGPSIEKDNHEQPDCCCLEVRLVDPSPRS